MRSISADGSVDWGTLTNIGPWTMMRVLRPCLNNFLVPTVYGFRRFENLIPIVGEVQPGYERLSEMEVFRTHIAHAEASSGSTMPPVTDWLRLSRDQDDASVRTLYHHQVDKFMASYIRKMKADCRDAIASLNK